MKFVDLGLEGAYLVHEEPRGDERGYFARAYCVNEFEAQGLNHVFVQANMSGNTFKGTIRGLHYQDETAPEAKFIRCIRGSIYDVLVDMRPNSPTYLQWRGAHLSAENRDAVVIPPLFAHGYLSLEDGAEVFYQTSHVYTPTAERGVAFDDPAIGINWPIPVEHVSDKDRKWPRL